MQLKVTNWELGIVKLPMADEPSTITRPLERQRRAIVVGASSGIGASLVGELVQRGYMVAAVARREARLAELCEAINVATGGQRALPYTHNVTDYAAIPGLFQCVVSDLGGLDLIIYVAGVQSRIEADEYNFEKDAAMIRVNLLGAIAWLNQAAVRFKRAGQGQIAAISSIAGDRGRVGAPVYNASKAGLDTYLEALRNRLSRHGVAVTTVKPGFVDTVLLENAPKTIWVIAPEVAAEKICRAIEGRKQVVYIPARWRVVSLVIRSIPSFIFRRLNI